MISFHELYERHARDVYRFALFLTGNPATAEDLTSETFVRAWTARSRARHPSPHRVAGREARHVGDEGRDLGQGRGSAPVSHEWM